MAFMFHHIWDVIHQPLTNSYFSRWLKPPTSVCVYSPCLHYYSIIIHYCTLLYTVHTLYIQYILICVGQSSTCSWLLVMCYVCLSEKWVCPCMIQSTAYSSFILSNWPCMIQSMDCHAQIGQIPKSDGSIPIENSI